MQRVISAVQSCEDCGGWYQVFVEEIRPGMHQSTCRSCKHKWFSTEKELKALRQALIQPVQTTFLSGEGTTVSVPV